MDLVKSKEILANHVNLAVYIDNEKKNLDYTHCYSLEQKIMLAEDIKEVQQILENKMAKIYNRDKILRLLCLFSVT